MAANSLSDEMKAKGEAMLVELDRIGFKPNGAFWLYFPLVKDWRFAVVSDLVDVLGTRAIYGLLDDAIEAIGRSNEMTILDIHLYASSEVVPREFGSAFGVDGGRVDVAHTIINGKIYDAFVYRMRPPVSPGQAHRAGRLFKSSVKKLLAA